MKKIILVKFGGSLITDKTRVNKARLDIIKYLSRQVKEILENDNDLSLIIATGAGGFGHPVAKKYEYDLKKGLPLIKKAVKKINRIIVSSLTESEIKAVSVEPSKTAEYKNRRMIALFDDHIVSLLNRNIIPVFHADLINDQKLGILILSMDKFLVDIAIKFKHKGFNIDKVIFCGITDGVTDSQGKTVDILNEKKFSQFEASFYSNKEVDTSGGMRGKVKEGLRLTKMGIPCYIINGLKENNLKKLILGNKVTGTIILE